jgi:hypothetical protein
MDQHDPERRIADLEGQQGDAVGQARSDQAHRLNRGSTGHAGLGRPIFVGLMLALCPIIISGDLVHSAYAYHVGTPTTATNVVCKDVRNGRHSDRTCTGRWSLDGESYTGEIIGAPDRGGTLDVRVHDNTAYTADAAHINVPLVALCGVGGSIVAFAVGFKAVQSQRAARTRRQQRKP